MEGNTIKSGVDWNELFAQWLEMIQGQGLIGWILFIILYSLAGMTFLPGSVLSVGAGAIYGFWLGTVLVSISSAIGAMASFLAGRFIFRKLLLRKLDQSRRFLALDLAIDKEGWKIIFLSRLSPILPHSIVSYISGVTRISVLRYTLASWAGFIPISAAYSYVGALLGSIARSQANLAEGETSWAFYGFGAVITVVIIWLSGRVAKRAMRESLAEIDAMLAGRKKKIAAEEFFGEEA
ncbi:MAG: TVP38/TMEM64 family protein [Chthoniobacterales bacterium]